MPQPSDSHLGFGEVLRRAAIVLGPTVWLLALLLALRRREPFYTHFFPIAWWSYIVFLAALNERRTPSTLFRFPSLFRHPFHYGGLALFSCAVWFFFELYNVRLHNWGYIRVPNEFWVRWPGYFISFGTVLPGIFETARFIESLWFSVSQGDAPRTHLRWGESAGWLSVCTGAACMLLPIVYPRWLFPLIWVGLIFMLDPLLRGAGRHSLVLNLFSGDRRRPAILLVSGLICGFLWESWNYNAGAKWIYILPYFNSWKIFEMPLAGYLGFMPFALECWLLYVVAADLWRGAQPWFRSALLLLASMICWVGILAVDRYTVRTYRLQMDDTRFAGDRGSGDGAANASRAHVRGRAWEGNAPVPCACARPAS